MQTMTDATVTPSPTSFEEAWPVVERDVRVFLLASVGDYHDALDLTQRVAKAVYDKWGQYDPERSMRGWVIGFAKMEIQTYRRSKARNRLLLSPEVVEALADRASEPVDLGVRGDWLRRCLESLTDRVRSVLKLRYEQNEEANAIAKKLGMTRNHVDVMLHRARHTLKECVEQTEQKETSS